MQSVIEQVIARLRERGMTLAVAESCTGGRLAAAFTEAAGASEFFAGGVVAYSNEVKIAVLGVGRETIECNGAVSCQVAEEMACGARRATGADLAIAITGIAGPGGGTPDKPVGTVWIAVAGPSNGDSNSDNNSYGAVAAQKFYFADRTRTEVMESTVEAAIEMVLENLTESK